MVVKSTVSLQLEISDQNFIGTYTYSWHIMQWSP